METPVALRTAIGRGTGFRCEAACCPRHGRTPERAARRHRLRVAARTDNRLHPAPGRKPVPGCASLAPGASRIATRTACPAPDHAAEARASNVAGKRITPWFELEKNLTRACARNTRFLEGCRRSKAANMQRSVRRSAGAGTEVRSGVKKPSPERGSDRLAVTVGAAARTWPLLQVPGAFAAIERGARVSPALVDNRRRLAGSFDSACEEVPDAGSRP